MKVIKQTEKYCLIQDEEGNTKIKDKVSNCETKWYVGEEAQQQINLIKNQFNDGEFDEFCRREFTDVQN